MNKVIQDHCRNNNLDWVYDNLIILHHGGSRLYGTNNENSDVDVIGVTIAPQEFWIGARGFEQTRFTSADNGLELDVVIYDVRKWCSLVYGMNPNVIETLFVPNGSEALIHSNHAWEVVRREMAKVINKSAYSSFLGYASSQLKKLVIKHGNKTGRTEITDKYGFDLKYTSHCFRLCRAGRELLSTGKITFPCPDAQFLKDVKYGKVYNTVLRSGDLDRACKDLEEEIQKLKEAHENSGLPSKPDFDVYNNLLQRIFLDYALKNEKIK